MIQQQMSQSSFTKSVVNRKMNKINLFITVRILLQILSKENPRMRIVAQKALKDSYKLHQKYPEVTSLASLIEISLREAVGEKYWMKAQAIQRRGCSASVKSLTKKRNQSIFELSLWRMA